jgi:hypothetical protein
MATVPISTDDTGRKGGRGDLVGCGGRWSDGGSKAGDAFDHVAYGLEGPESVIGNLDGEGLFDLEGDVDLVEGVDVELVEGAGQSDRARGYALRFRDDFNAACGDVVHGGSTSFGLTQLTGTPIPL